MKDLDEFQSFYASGLVAKLKGIEKRRIDMKEMRMRTIVVAICIIFIHWAVIFLYLLPTWSIFLSLIAAPPAAYYYFRQKYYDEKIAPDFKEAAVKQIVAFADESLKYDPEGFVPFEEFRKSELYRLTPDHYSGDDLIKGTIDGKPAVISEIIAQYEDEDINANKKNPWKTIFKGIFIAIDLGAPLPFKTFVFSDDLQARLGYTGQAIQEGNIMYGHYVNARDQQFSDYFVMYSEEPVKAEKMLTPKFKEEVVQLRQNSQGNIRIAFTGSKVYVAIERQKDFFEVNLNHSLLDFRYLSSFYKDLYYVSKIIEDLDISEMMKQEEPKAEAP